MKKIIIYGASDDLVEIEGDINAEYNYYDEPYTQYLAFSDGTVLSIYYSNKGIWQIRQVVMGTAKYSKEEITEHTEDDDAYSDIVTLESDNLQWVIFGCGIAYPIPED